MSWGWGKGIVAVTVGMLVGGLVVLRLYRGWVEMAGDGSMLFDSATVGLGLVLVHGLIRWGAEMGSTWGERRVWGGVGGWVAAAVLCGGVLAFPHSGRVEGPHMFVLWVLAAGWCMSEDWLSWRGRSVAVRAMLVPLTIWLYAVTVFPLWPLALGGARTERGVLVSVEGPLQAEVVRWRSGSWVFDGGGVSIHLPWSPIDGIDVRGLGDPVVPSRRRRGSGGHEGFEPSDEVPGEGGMNSVAF